MNSWIKYCALGLISLFQGVWLLPLAEAVTLPTRHQGATHRRLQQDHLLAQRRRYVPRRGRHFPRWGSPVWSRGGAARGGCDETEAPLIPLMPVLTESGKEPGFFGVTFSARPTFFAYVPATRARQVELLLVDEQHTQSVIYQRSQPISGKPQIISFTLGPETTLTPERNYKWFFTTLCNPDDLVKDDNSGNPSISGLVEFHTASVNFSTQPSQKLVDELAQQGAWVDALATNARLYCQTPNHPQIAASWRGLLADMELEKIPKLAARVQSSAIANTPIACNQ